ncbi:MAG: hypothetical protein ABWJ42_03910 [Sulfolobales archaeon]
MFSSESLVSQNDVNLSLDLDLVSNLSVKSLLLEREDLFVDRLSERVKKIFTIKEFLTLANAKDLYVDIFIRELLQEWIYRIGFPPYKPGFIERVLSQKTELFRDHDKILSVENLIEILSLYFSNKNEFSSDDIDSLLKYVEEELEYLDMLKIIKELDIKDPVLFLKYTAYALYITVVSSLDL